MAESTILRTKRDGQIVISDNAGANSYTLAYEPGDFSYTIPDQTTVNTLDRGIFGATPSLRPGDDQPMTLGFSAHQRDVGDTGGAYATLEDILYRYTGGYVDTNWVSTMGANADFFTVTVALTIDGAIAGEADKTLTFNFVRLTGGASEGDPNVVTVSGTAYALRPVLS
jgi:hypothetical protein